ncbi:hypothetical protein DPV78_011000 [Talaromyces pinophilus]|nr:hypothetical protein DPV78_011000 [Talaromyces pinophilus]
MSKAGATDTMGTYTITRCAYESSDNSVRNIDITPVQGLTVRHITHLITRNGRDRYMLAPSGVGCRYWVATVIHDVASVGYISPTSSITANSAVQLLRYNYSRGKNAEYEEIVPGRFV